MLVMKVERYVLLEEGRSQFRGDSIIRKIAVVIPINY